MNTHHIPVIDSLCDAILYMYSGGNKHVSQWFSLFQGHLASSSVSLSTRHLWKMWIVKERKLCIGLQSKVMMQLHKYFWRTKHRWANRAILVGNLFCMLYFAKATFIYGFQKIRPNSMFWHLKFSGVFESPKWRDSIAPGVSSWTCLFGPNPPGTRCHCQWNLTWRKTNSCGWDWIGRFDLPA